MSNQEEVVILLPISADDLKPFFAGVLEQKDLKAEKMTQAQANVERFNSCMKYLLKWEDDPEIAEMFKNLYNLIRDKKNVLVVQSPEVSKVKLTRLNPLLPQVVIILPENFHQLFEENMSYQLGNILRVGFLAYHLSVHFLSYILQQKKINDLSHEIALKKGKFLKKFFEITPGNPNNYQQSVIKAYEDNLG